MQTPTIIFLIIGLIALVTLAVLVKARALNPLTLAGIFVGGGLISSATVLFG